jgi:hypothetical protein
MPVSFAVTACAAALPRTGMRAGRCGWPLRRPPGAALLVGVMMVV